MARLPDRWPTITLPALTARLRARVTQRTRRTPALWTPVSILAMSYPRDSVSPVPRVRRHARRSRGGYPTRKARSISRDAREVNGSEIPATPRSPLDGAIEEWLGLLLLRDQPLEPLGERHARGVEEAPQEDRDEGQGAQEPVRHRVERGEGEVA